MKSAKSIFVSILTNWRLLVKPWTNRYIGITVEYKISMLKNSVAPPRTSFETV